MRLSSLLAAVAAYTCYGRRAFSSANVERKSDKPPLVALASTFLVTNPAKAFQPTTVDPVRRALRVGRRSNALAPQMVLEAISSAIADGAVDLEAVSSLSSVVPTEEIGSTLQSVSEVAQAISPVSPTEDLKQDFETVSSVGQLKSLLPELDNYCSPGYLRPCEEYTGIKGFFKRPFDDFWYTFAAPPEAAPIDGLGMWIIMLTYIKLLYDDCDPKLEKNKLEAIRTAREITEEAEDDDGFLSGLTDADLDDIDPLAGTLGRSWSQQ